MTVADSRVAQPTRTAGPKPILALPLLVALSVLVLVGLRAATARYEMGEDFQLCAGAARWAG